MFNVCPACGEYSDDKDIDLRGPFAICKLCGHKHAFKRLPLLVVTGSSGTGKTTVGLQLAATMQEAVCLESDILWRDEFDKPETEYADYRNLWLRIAKNIGQAGRPIVLFGSATPGQFERCAESRYFSWIAYLALVCDEKTLTKRLCARPQWRKSGTDDVLKRMSQFNQWIKDNASKTTPPMTVLDTTNMNLEQSVAAVRGWIQDQMRPSLEDQIGCLVEGEVYGTDEYSL